MNRWLGGIAAGGALALLSVDSPLPENVVEWVTLLIALLSAYLSWKKSRS